MRNRKRYPWDRWLRTAGRELKLQRNNHYECASYVMAGQIRNAATSRGKKVSLRVTEDTIYVTVKEATNGK